MTFNPDRLPAHAEPEQAAQLLTQQLNQSAHTHAHRNHAPPVSTYAQAAPIQAAQQHSPHYVRPHQSMPMTMAQSQSPRHASYTQPPPPQPYGGSTTYIPSSMPGAPIVTTAPTNGHPAYQQRRPVAPAPPPPQQAQPHPAQGGGYPPTTTGASAPVNPRSDSPPDLLPIFRAANTSGSGLLTERELGAALVNGDFTSFDPTTVRMMIRMFSVSDPAGRRTVDFDGFVDLWRYLASWRDLFVRFDTDRSGRISMDEFENALRAFGFRLSTPFVATMYGIFEGRARRRAGTAAARDPGAVAAVASMGGISFDLFVQAVLILKKVTDAFKQYDTDRDGYVTLSFEEFLTEIFNLQE